MKARLEFDLNDYEDKLAFNRATTATEVYLIIHSLQDYFRTKLKYTELHSMEESAIESIQDELQSLLEKYNIDMGNLQ